MWLFISMRETRGALSVLAVSQGSILRVLPVLAVVRADAVSPGSTWGFVPRVLAVLAVFWRSALLILAVLIV